DGGVNVALPVSLRRLRIHRVAVEVVFDEVGGGDEARREIAREKEMVGALGAARADMAETVENVFVRQNAVGDDNIVDDDARRSLRRVTGLPRERLGREECCRGED